MGKTSLDALAREQLAAAARATSGRAATIVMGGHEHSMRQSVVALMAGAEPAEHDNPGKASIYVLTGRIELHAGGETWEARSGDLIEVPPARHSVTAIEDSAILITVVPHAVEPPASLVKIGHPCAGSDSSWVR